MSSTSLKAPKVTCTTRRARVRDATFNLGPSQPVMDEHRSWILDLRRSHHLIPPNALNCVPLSGEKSIEFSTMLSAGRRAFLTTPSLNRSPAALRRLLSALAVLEQRDGKLNIGSLSAITAAQKLGGSIHAFVAGSSIKTVAEEATKVEGVDKVISVDNSAYDKVRHSAPLLYLILS